MKLLFLHREIPLILIADPAPYLILKIRWVDGILYEVRRLRLARASQIEDKQKPKSKGVAVLQSSLKTILVRDITAPQAATPKGEHAVSDSAPHSGADAEGKSVRSRGGSSTSMSGAPDAAESTHSINLEPSLEKSKPRTLLTRRPKVC